MCTPRSPSSSGALSSIDAAARRSTLKLPIRLTRITRLEQLEAVRALAAGGLLGRADAGAADADPQAVVARGVPDGGLDVGLLRDVGGDEVGAELLGQRGAALGVDIGDRDVGARGVRAACGGGAKT